METDKINYKITFLSDWHAGSGLGSGADADAVVIKDANNLPYLPGKTIKGLIKDSLLDIKEVQPEMMPKDFIKTHFGYEVRDENKKVIRTEPGSLFFSNADETLRAQHCCGRHTVAGAILLRAPYCCGRHTVADTAGPGGLLDSNLTEERLGYETPTLTEERAGY